MPYGDGAYGDGLYKGVVTSVTSFEKPEPIIFFAFENRAFFFSHKANTITGDREYRVSEFLRYGQTQNEFMFGG